MPIPPRPVQEVKDEKVEDVDARDLAIPSRDDAQNQITELEDEFEQIRRIELEFEKETMTKELNDIIN